ncbi:Ppx/GppA phosphatase family protein [Robbsia sp. Bb-Pol-6]|uniref:Ppx/GppA phosphatase family protein n=1 Tax=Robbsia betulipollinis TaxID=2981849 RepID=A0ABT3ZPL5_9BURK|nr:Ppx/GppA phosphatase family protein [Robbsia betulipollinis]MCY0388493.1 Ppx/GppA phosphatase family protein [Robbsia betulipollinis]
MVETPKLLAAVDLGSNSFRLIVGRVEETAAGHHIQQIDAMRDPVRLGAGLGEDKHLDEAAQLRGLAALERFGERLRDFHPDRVRAVATNTLRVARNAPEFLERAHRALGFPVEVIAGREEARLIYAGAAHTVPPIDGRRLVVDIGGGSTEFIIGAGYQPLLLESLYIGCVSHSLRFFPEGAITEQGMRQAVLAARRSIEIIAGQYRELGWEQSIGSSGTARALAELIEDNGFNDPDVAHGITRSGLDKLRRALVKAGSAQASKLVGLKPDRIPVLPGGLSIMIGVFDELGIDYADITDGALRLGVLYDLMGRSSRQDMRAVTVEGFMQRYSVERKQAERIGALAVSLYRQLDARDDAAREEGGMFLAWAAALHEIGLSIGHSGYHKHSAYIASNADMPGFSKTDQSRLAALLIGHVGKLGKFTHAAHVDWSWLFCLRTAVLLCRRRADVALPDIAVRESRHGYEVTLPRSWAEANPLTDYSLAQEANEWSRVGRGYRIAYADR